MKTLAIYQNHGQSPIVRVIEIDKPFIFHGHVVAASKYAHVVDPSGLLPDRYTITHLLTGAAICFAYSKPGLKKSLKELDNRMQLNETIINDFVAKFNSKNAESVGNIVTNFLLLSL